MTNIPDPYNIWMYPLITLEGSLFWISFHLHDEQAHLMNSKYTRLEEDIIHAQNKIRHGDQKRQHHP
nr:Uncharacterised protein [Citrobacter werkmanii]